RSSAVATPELSKYPPSLTLFTILSAGTQSLIEFVSSIEFVVASHFMWNHAVGVTHGNRALNTAAVLSGTDSILPSCVALADVQLTGKNLRSLSPSNVKGEISRRRPVSTSVVFSTSAGVNSDLSKPCGHSDMNGSAMVL